MPELLGLAEHFEREARTRNDMRELFLSLAELFKSHAYGDEVTARRISALLMAKPARVN